MENLLRWSVAVVLGLAVSASASAASFEILAQDKSVVTELRTDDDDNVYIRLASSHLNDQIVVRISNRDRDYYRTWFNGELDLVSSGFRGNDVWSDRVQTKANYIEYWLGEKLVLHLKRK